MIGRFRLALGVGTIPFGAIPGWLNGIGALIILSGIYLSLRSEEGSDGNEDRSGEDRMG